jgi:nucleoside-diphosphate-sugar epimerase
VARVLIVGCGCRGRELAAALIADGYAVRGTTRDRASVAAIEAAGAEAAVCDPDRLSTLLPQVDGVGVVCWLMGSAAGEPELVAAAHGARLEAFLERLVDSPVRGFVYEAAGRVPREWLESGAELATRFQAERRIPAEVVSEDPSDPGRWLEAMVAAVQRVLTR